MTNISVYAAEYLSMLEFMTSAEKELPEVKLFIYGESELMESLPAEAMDYFAGSFDELLSNKILVLLSPLEDESLIANYTGTVIDAVSDPLFKLLYSIVSINEESHLTLGLPLAVYGKDGVDSLMRETRSIYTFDEDVDSVLPMRIAFNMHFYKEALPGGIWENEIAELKKYTSLNLRINPTSTVFVADIYCSEEIELPEDTGFFTPETDFSFEDINSSPRIALIRSPDDKMLTLAGDYLHMKTAELIEAVKRTLS